jgi:pimeloyl-ACP methyl ester carboxylesterase
VSEITRTCAYDRANLGRSDPAPGPRTISELAEDLVKLLDVADVPGPYVFVGGSFGGNLIGVLSANHPDLVAGLVFIDSEPATLVKDNPFARNLPDGVFESCCMAPAWDANPEHIDYFGGIEAEVATVGKQPHVPARVLTATKLECQATWPCDKILEDEIALQARWIEGNPLGKQVLIETGHVVQRELPKAIVNHTRDVVEQVRSG